MAHKDDDNLISLKTAKKLSILIYNYNSQFELKERYKAFLENEKHCANDVRISITVFKMVIMNEALKALSFNIKEPFDIGSLSVSVSNILQNIFALGMSYGKASFNDDDLETLLKLSEEEQNLGNLQKEIIKMDILGDSLLNGANVVLPPDFPELNGDISIELDDDEDIDDQFNDINTK